MKHSLVKFSSFFSPNDENVCSWTNLNGGTKSIFIVQCSCDNIDHDGPWICRSTPRSPSLLVVEKLFVYSTMKPTFRSAIRSVHTTLLQCPCHSTMSSLLYRWYHASYREILPKYLDRIFSSERSPVLINMSQPRGSSRVFRGTENFCICAER